MSGIFFLRDNNCSDSKILFKIEIEFEVFREKSTIESVYVGPNLCLHPQLASFGQLGA
jgi:hypothetical protein